MKKPPRLYLELTTARLLGNYDNRSLVLPIPAGSLHLLIPRNNNRVHSSFRLIAECFSKLGGQVVIRYIP